MKTRRAIAVLFFLLMLSFILAPAPIAAWGDEGHRWINRAAAEKMPDDMPAFFKQAAGRLSFLGPEPDRWRDRFELYRALNEAQSPDHFIDIDKPENFQALPDNRYQYADWLRASGKEPKDVGFLPYSILENYQRIQVLFRLWRDPRNASERDQIEQNIIYYAGVLGHYVADGAQPLHTTIHFDGWSTGSNPDQFTREHLHARFESEYVRFQIKAEDFSPQVKTARKLNDVFADTMKFLFDSNGQVGELYRLEKTARWDQNNRNAESKRFVTARLAAGTQMLANLWYTAWMDSTLPQVQ
ncbi:MAG: S1/P1 nuclease [Acidobacteriota bacterium]